MSPFSCIKGYLCKQLCSQVSDYTAMQWAVHRCIHVPTCEPPTSRCEFHESENLQLSTMAAFYSFS